MSESRKLICAYCGEVDPDHVCMEDDTEWEDVPAAAPAPGKMDRMMQEPAGREGRDRQEIPLGEIDGPDGERYEHRLVVDRPGTPARASEEDFAEVEGVINAIGSGRSAGALSRVLAEVREAQRHSEALAVGYMATIDSLCSRVEQLEGALREITATDWGRGAASRDTPFQFEQRIHAIAAAALFGSDD